MVTPKCLSIAHVCLFGPSLNMMGTSLPRALLAAPRAFSNGTGSLFILIPAPNISAAYLPFPSSNCASNSATDLSTLWPSTYCNVYGKPFLLSLSRSATTIFSISSKEPQGFAACGKVSTLRPRTNMWRSVDIFLPYVMGGRRNFGLSSEWENSRILKPRGCECSG
ncbi:hypothetical protein BX600DRAFT_320797 [Xylariales sp. PMI_506]|nr:hypothetical protein BX600DRAFT_320797 [Xylariales sp. PMI_506]